MKKVVIWGYSRVEHIRTYSIIVAAVVFALAIGALSGCASLSERPATVGFIAEYATAKVIYESSDPVAKAERIASIANDALEVATGGGIEISLIREAVERVIDWDSLEPPDRVAARRLLAILSEELQIRLGAGVLDPSQLESVRSIIEVVRDTAANFELE